jgi:hypothetical protein
VITARWQDWSGEIIERMVLQEGPDQITAESALERKGALFARYILVCDNSWRTRRATVHAGGRKIELESDGAGNWSLDGQHAPALNGAIDIDITATPFTNTLPIRRLELKAGQQKDILVAYVDVPELAVTAEPQRYTCIEPGRLYRFESSGGDFVRDIRVDESFLVVDYPGLFKRLP